MILKLEQMLEQHLKRFYPDLLGMVEIELNINQERRFGTFSSNIAFKLSPLLSGTPLEHAKNWAAHLCKCKGLKAIKAEPPGYLNFFLERGFEREVLKHVIALKPFRTPDESSLKSNFAVEWRQHYRRQCLKNIADYCQLQLQRNEQATGSVAHSISVLMANTDVYRFSVLELAHTQDWLSIDECGFESPVYAYQRNSDVLCYLNEITFEDESLPKHWCFKGEANLIFNDILLFESLLCRVVRQGSPQILAIFLKNLATRIHCLYNEITLYSGDMHHDLMHRYLLQACQKILRLSFDLLGICKP
jgi:arginyl-tRNA synthetase